MRTLGKNDRATGLLIALALFGLVTFFTSTVPKLSQIEETKVDLNTADMEALLQIPKLSKKTATAILEKRRVLSRFSSYEQIDTIKGVGQKTLELIKLHSKLGVQVDSKKQ